MGPLERVRVLLRKELLYCVSSGITLFVVVLQTAVLAFGFTLFLQRLAPIMAMNPVALWMLYGRLITVFPVSVSLLLSFTLLTRGFIDEKKGGIVAVLLVMGAQTGELVAARALAISAVGYAGGLASSALGVWYLWHATGIAPTLISANFGVLLFLAAVCMPLVLVSYYCFLLSVLYCLKNSQVLMPITLMFMTGLYILTGVRQLSIGLDTFCLALAALSVLFSLGFFLIGRYVLGNERITAPVPW